MSTASRLRVVHSRARRRRISFLSVLRLHVRTAVGVFATVVYDGAGVHVFMFRSPETGLSFLRQSHNIWPWANAHNGVCARTPSAFIYIQLYPYVRESPNPQVNNHFIVLTQFSVKTVKWGDGIEPHEITIEAFQDNRRAGADLPLAPWS